MRPMALSLVTMTVSMVLVAAACDDETAVNDPAASGVIEQANEVVQARNGDPTQAAKRGFPIGEGPMTSSDTLHDQCLSTCNRSSVLGCSDEHEACAAECALIASGVCPGLASALLTCTGDAGSCAALVRCEVAFDAFVDCAADDLV